MNTKLLRNRCQLIVLAILCSLSLLIGYHATTSVSSAAPDLPHISVDHEDNFGNG